MTLILLLCVMLLASTTAMECQNGIQINMTCYTLYHVMDLQGDFRQKIVVNQLGMLRKSRILYYSYEPSLANLEYDKVGFTKLYDQSMFGEINLPKIFPLNFGCFDFDQANNIMYLGGSEGIYKYTVLNNSLSYFSSRGQRILSLFFKDKLYYIAEGENKIMFQKEGGFESLFKDDKRISHEEFMTRFTVKKFVITNDNIVVFINALGLFAAKAEMNDEFHRLSKTFFFGLVLDVVGEVYTWWDDGIYKVVLDKNLANSTVVKIANIPRIGALLFDHYNSILFTAEKSLFRLDRPDYEIC